MVGRAPAFFLANVFGRLIGTGNTALAALVLALGAGLSAVGYRYRDRLTVALTALR